MSEEKVKQLYDEICILDVPTRIELWKLLDCDYFRKLMTYDKYNLSSQDITLLEFLIYGSGNLSDMGVECNTYAWKAIRNHIQYVYPHPSYPCSLCLCTSDKDSLNINNTDGIYSLKEIEKELIKSEQSEEPYLEFYLEVNGILVSLNTFLLSPEKLSMHPNDEMNMGIFSRTYFFNEWVKKSDEQSVDQTTKSNEQNVDQTTKSNEQNEHKCCPGRGCGNCSYCLGDCEICFGPPDNTDDKHNDNDILPPGLRSDYIKGHKLSYDQLSHALKTKDFSKYPLPPETDKPKNVFSIVRTLLELRDILSDSEIATMIEKEIGPLNYGEYYQIDCVLFGDKERGYSRAAYDYPKEGDTLMDGSTAVNCGFFTFGKIRNQEDV